MKKIKKTTYWLVAVITVVVSITQADIVVQPTAVSAFMNNEIADGTINGEGINNIFMIETGDTVPTTWPICSGKNSDDHRWRGIWLGESSYTNTGNYVTFTLGKAYDVTGLYWWGSTTSDGRGTEAVTIAISTNGVDYTDIVSNYDVMNPDGTAEVRAGEFIDFGSTYVNVTHVRVDNVQYYGHQGYIQEVRITATAPLPAPPVWLEPVAGTTGVKGMNYIDMLMPKAHDVNNELLTFMKTGGHAWLNVDTNGVLRGIPDVLGTNTFTVTVDDGNGSPVATTLTIFITEPPPGEHISINFTHTTSEVFAGSELIGPLYTDSSNWNVLIATNAPSGTETNLIDHAGVVTTLDLDWSARGTYNNRIDDASIDDENKLAWGYLDDADIIPVTATLTEIPYDDYRVYVLLSSDQAQNNSNGYDASNALVTDGSNGGVWAFGGDDQTTRKCFSSIKVTQSETGLPWSEATDSKIGNYWVMDNLSGSALTIAIGGSSTPGRASIAGIIIEELAKPSPRPTTPIMGWSSWNKFKININEKLIREQADAMVSSGMKAAGYRYINTDDGFFGGRTAAGVLFCDFNKFPAGMKAQADYIHSKGLKAGIYSDAGVDTCASRWDYDPLGFGVGLYHHDTEDLTLMLRTWGYDFIKVDWCGGQKLGLNSQTRYTEIGRQIYQVNSNAVYNVCRWSYPGDWVKEVADSWRVSGDIKPNFGSMMHLVDKCEVLWEHCSPGHFNDMDMMQIGRGMSEDEDKTHFTMWCMMTSPLLAGNDLRGMSQTTIDILTHPEIIALNQDKLCYQARRLRDDGDMELWAKPLDKLGVGDIAITLLNRSGSEATISFNPSEVGIDTQTEYSIRNLWEKTTISESTKETTQSFTVPSHGVVVLRIKGQALQNHPFSGNSSPRVYLSDINWVSQTTGWGGSVKKNLSIQNNPIVLDGTTYPKGLGTHAQSEIVYNFEGNYVTFHSIVGVDDETGANGSVIFKVYGDDVLLYETAAINATGTETLNIDMAGVKTLKLVVDGNGSIAHDHADWAEAYILSDNDSDGLADEWEITHFGDITAQDGAGDPDNDGVSNHQEQTFNTDPMDANDAPSAEYINLRGWWKLDETTGTIAADSSGNGLDASNTGGVQVGQVGHVDGAFTFDGVDGCSTTTGTDAPNSSILTITAWIHPTLLSDKHVILEKRDQFIFETSDNTLRMISFPNRSHYSDAVLIANEWQFVAVTFTPSTTGGCRFYRNGVLIGTVDSVAINQNSNALSLGKSQAWNQHFEGGLDDIRLYDRILTDTEINTLYQQDTGFYNQWKGTHFTAAERANPAISGDDADVDADQLSTLVEYALGLDPKTHSGSLAGCAIELDGSNGWKVEFNRHASHSDIDLVLEWTDELNPANWQPVAESIAGGAVQPLNGASLVSETGSEPTVVELNVPSTIPHGFIRWKVERR